MLAAMKAEAKKSEASMKANKAMTSKASEDQPNSAECEDVSHDLREANDLYGRSAAVPGQRSGEADDSIGSSHKRPLKRLATGQHASEEDDSKGSSQKRQRLATTCCPCADSLNRVPPRNPTTNPSPTDEYSIINLHAWHQQRPGKPWDLRRGFQPGDLGCF